LAQVDKNLSYHEREEILDNKKTETLDVLKERITQLEKEKRISNSWNLSEILAKKVSIEPLGKIVEESLLMFLIRHGYVDEMYPNFISYFYEGSLKKNDIDFVFSIKNRTSLGFNHKLIKVQQLLKKLRVSEFEQKEVLNYNLLDFLIQNHLLHPLFLKAFYSQLSDESEESKSFIEGYIDYADQVKDFIRLMGKNNPSFWQYIVNKSKFSTKKKDDYLRLILKHVDLLDISRLDIKNMLSKYLNEKKDFLSLFKKGEYLEKQKKVIKKLNLSFEELEKSTNDNDLLNFIYENNYYKINSYMIRLMIESFATEEPEEEQLSVSNYTTITGSDCDPLKKYIEENIQEYITDVFLKIEDNTLESENSVLELSNNKNLSIENKEAVILKQDVTISDFNTITNKLWAFLLTSSKIDATWLNVINHYNEESSVIDNSLLDFLNKENNYQSLTKSKISEAEDYTTEDKIVKDLSKSILLSNDLTNEAYVKLIQSVPFTYNSLSFEKVSDEKIGILIENDLLNLTVANYDLLKAYFEKRHIELLENKISEYLKSPDDFSLDQETEFEQLFDSKKLSQDEKLKLINSVDSAIITKNSKLSELIGSLVIKFSDYKLNFELLNALIKNGPSTSLSVKLINNQFEHILPSGLTLYLINLGKPYSDITVKGKSPRLKNDDDNYKLISNLERTGYISSFNKTISGLLKVNTKRK